MEILEIGFEVRGERVSEGVIPQVRHWIVLSPE